MYIVPYLSVSHTSHYTLIVLQLSIQYCFMEIYMRRFNYYYSIVAAYFLFTFVPIFILKPSSGVPCWR